MGRQELVDDLNESLICVRAVSAIWPAVAETADVLSEREFVREVATVQPYLMRVAKARMRHHHAAEDLLQETIFSAWKARDQFTKGTSFKAWTSSIMHNLFITHVRRSRRQIQFLALPFHQSLRRADQAVWADLKDLQQALCEIAAPQRDAILMIARDGLTYKEAARATGVAVGTLKSQVNRGRIALLAFLNEDTLPACKRADGGTSG